MGKFQDVFELLSMERKICVAGHEKYVSWVYLQNVQTKIILNMWVSILKYSRVWFNIFFIYKYMIVTNIYKIYKCISHACICMDFIIFVWWWS
jgi:glycosylphosphatidylinositol transamidase (GPIT) subunit GPI8